MRGYGNDYTPLFRNREQQYNEPMSMYVDPKLDVLANSLGAIQKRHDENYAAMSAFDIMAHNIQVAEGDAQLKAEALAKLKTQKDAIAASGDYALATPRIGMAVKDFSTNQNLTMAQENMKAIQKAQEQAQALGASALDFNPAQNWSTVDPATGQARRFVSGIEKQLDWDARAQEVTKLVADAKNLGLTAANVRDYLQSGTLSGISDAKVQAYLPKAIDRFMNSAEGIQMKKKLTKIDGLSDAQANGEIANFLSGVGQAQVHQREDVNYQANAPALQREGWAREDEQKRLDREAELEEARIKAAATSKGKTPGDEGYTPNPFMQMLAPTNTTIAPSALKGILPEGKIPGSFSIPLKDQLIDFAKLPNAIDETDLEFKNYVDRYRQTFGDKDISYDKIKTKKHEMTKEEEALKRSIEKGKTIYWDQQTANRNGGNGWNEGAPLSAASKNEKLKRLNEVRKTLSTVKQIEQEAKEKGYNLADKDRYSKIVKNDAVKLGNILTIGGQGDFIMDTGANNKVNVDGDVYLKGRVVLNENELKQRMKDAGYADGDDWTGSPLPGTGSWYSGDEWQDEFLDKGLIQLDHTDEAGVKHYSFPVKKKLEVTPSIQNAYNRANLPDKAYSDNLENHANDLLGYQYLHQTKTQAKAISRSIKDTKLKSVVNEYIDAATQAERSDVLAEIAGMSEAQLKEQFKDKLK